MRRVTGLGLGLWALATSAALAAEPGEQLYADNCLACHQAEGQGIAGAFPPLAADRVVVGDTKELAGVVLHGRGGMPAYKDGLSDADLATILTYIRASWGNKAGPVTEAEVATARTSPPPPPSNRLQAH